MDAVNTLTLKLIEAQDKLTEHEAVLHRKKRVAGAGASIAGLLAGSAEFIPSAIGRTLMDGLAVLVGFCTAVGPGLESLQISRDNIKPQRRKVSGLIMDIKDEITDYPELYPDLTGAPPEELGE